MSDSSVTESTHSSEGLTLAERIVRCRAVKQRLVNMVSTALIKEPKFDPKSPSSFEDDLKSMLHEISAVDPEFPLKLAVYVRDDLGLRGSANLITALSAYVPSTAVFLSTYLKKIIVLPSDWLQVATFARDLPDRSTTGLPTALRKALVPVFSAFSEFSLAKYNKESAQKKKAKRQAAAAEDEDEATSDDDEKPLPPFTLKQIIRMLHIDANSYFVMSVLGKRYPDTAEEFQALGLAEGGRTFDPSKAGTRMRLAVPKTWETELAAKGNHAYVWDELVESNQLPFMAMLRNLRNIILAGCEPSTHEAIMKRLKSEDQIASSRQFPYRFFSAYDALDFKWEDVYESASPDAAPVRSRGRVRGAPAAGGRGGGARPVKKKPWPPTNIPNDELLQQYREALDKAVQLATAINIRPINGRTIVAIHASDELNSNVEAAGGAKGIGASVRTYCDVAVLLGLMFKYACEDCQLIFFAKGSYKELTLQRNGKILENMAAALAQLNQIHSAAPDHDSSFPFAVLEDVLNKRAPLDGLVVIDTHHCVHADTSGKAPGSSGAVGVDLPFMLARLRRAVNPNLLYVSVDVKGGRGGEDQSDQFTNPNDAVISGFSDAILRFVAERSNGGALGYVERIDQVKNIDASAARAKLVLQPSAAPTGAAKGADEAEDVTPSTDEAETITTTDASSGSTTTSDASNERLRDSDGMVECRFFLSSTFLDMKSERDALTLDVFPALRRRCQQLKVPAVISEVDLRWGITHDDAERKMTTSICLNEAATCAPFFLGMVGARRGYCPTRVDFAPVEGSRVPAEHFDWLKAQLPPLSITELEYRQAAESVRILRDSGDLKADAPTMVLLVRDAAVTANTVPNSHRHLFVAESADAAAAQARFVKAARGNAEVRCIKYRAPFTNYDTSNAISLSMDDFKRRAFNALWDVVCRATGFDESTGRGEDSEGVADPLAYENALQAHAVAATQGTFRGRTAEVEAIERFVMSALRTTSDGSSYDAGSSTTSCVLVAHGAEGTGKSALALNFARRAAQLGTVLVVAHSFAIGDGSVESCAIRVATELIKGAALEADFKVPATADDALDKLRAIYVAAAKLARVVIVLDDLDRCADAAALLTALPTLVPTPAPDANMRWIVTANSSSDFYNALKQRRPAAEGLTVGDLAPEDRAPIIRAHLARIGKKLLESKRLGNQVLPLTKKAESGRPAYLTQVLTYLRLFASFETLDRDIRSVGSTSAALQTDMLARYEKRFSIPVCRAVLVALYLSRPLGGILEVDAQRLGPVGTVGEARLLLGAMEAVLERRGGAVQLSDTGVCTAIAKRYLRGRDDIPKAHAALVEYYIAPLRSGDDKGSSSSTVGSTTALNGRSIRDIPLATLQGAAGMAKAKADERRELPYQRLAGRSLLCLMHHALYSKQYDIIEAMVSSVVCIESIIESSLLPQLLNTIASLATVARLVHRSLQPFVEFLIAHRHILAKHRDLTLQCALNMPPKSVVHRAAMRVSQADRDGRSMVLWRNRDDHGESDCTQTTVVTSKDVLAVHFEDSGKKLAIAGSDWACRVVDVYDGSINRVVKHPNDVTAVVLLRNTIITGCEDGNVRIFSRLDGAMIGQGTDHTRCITQIAVHPQGQYLMTSSLDGTVKRWALQSDAKRMKCLWSLRRHGAPVSSVAIHSSGRVHVSGGWEGRAYFFTLDRDSKPVWFNTKRGCAVRAVAFAPSMVVIAAVASYDGGVDLFDYAGEVHQMAFSSYHLGAPITSIEYSADGKRMISSDVFGTVNLWRSGVVGEILSVYKGHARPVTAAVFDPTDSTKLITASRDGTVRHWLAPVNEPRPATRHAALVSCARTSPDGNFIITASRDGTGHLLSTVEGTRIYFKHESPITAVAFGPRSNMFVSGDIAGNVKAWGCRPGLGGNDCEFLWTAACGAAIQSLDVEDFTMEPSNVRICVWVLQTHGGVRRLNHGAKGAPEMTVDPCVGRGATCGALIANDVFAAFGHCRVVGKVYGSSSSATSFKESEAGADDEWSKCVAVLHEDDETVVAVGYDQGTIRFFAAPYIDAFEDYLEVKLNDEFMQTGAGTAINALAWLSGTHIVAACADRSVRFLRIDADEVVPELMFFATAPVTAVCAVSTSTVVCGDALGNVYRLSGQNAKSAASGGHAPGSRMHTATTAESAVETVEDDDDFAADDTSYGAHNKPAEQLLQAYSDPEAFAIITQDIPRGLRGVERRDWLVKQRNALRAAMKLHRVSPWARAAMREYAQKGMGMMSAYQRLAAADGAGKSAGPHPIFATFER